MKIDDDYNLTYFNMSVLKLSVQLEWDIKNTTNIVETNLP